MTNSNHNFSIKKPWISEKSTAMAEMGKYVFLVEPTAKSLQVKQMIEKIYKVHVVKMNMVRIKHQDKKGVKNMKKAIATLKKGESIDIIPH